MMASENTQTTGGNMNPAYGNLKGRVFCRPVRVYSDWIVRIRTSSILLLTVRCCSVIGRRCKCVAVCANDKCYVAALLSIMLIRSRSLSVHYFLAPVMTA